MVPEHTQEDSAVELKTTTKLDKKGESAKNIRSSREKNNTGKQKSA